jgi:hypothetical protein
MGTYARIRRSGAHVIAACTCMIQTCRKVPGLGYEHARRLGAEWEGHLQPNTKSGGIRNHEGLPDGKAARRNSAGAGLRFTFYAPVARCQCEHITIRRRLGQKENQGRPVRPQDDHSRLPEVQRSRWRFGLGELRLFAGRTRRPDPLSLRSVPKLHCSVILAAGALSPGTLKFAARHRASRTEKVQDIGDSKVSGHR